MNYVITGPIVADACFVFIPIQNTMCATRTTTQPTCQHSDFWTCRRIRNLPLDYTRQDLLDLLDSNELRYNFVYLPIDFVTRANFGYAFVNFLSTEESVRAFNVLNGYSDWRVPSQKVIEIDWAHPDQQTFDNIKEHWKNKPVMHRDVP